MTDHSKTGIWKWERDGTLTNLIDEAGQEKTLDKQSDLPYNEYARDGPLLRLYKKLVAVLKGDNT